MDILGIFIEYVTGLNWPYILTLIILAYGADKISDQIKLLDKIPRVWRVFGFGLIYGVLLALFMEYSASQIHNLFMSLIFAMVFHDLIRVRKWIETAIKKINDASRN